MMIAIATEGMTETGILTEETIEEMTEETTDGTTEETTEEMTDGMTEGITDLFGPEAITQMVILADVKRSK